MENSGRRHHVRHPYDKRRTVGAGAKRGGPDGKAGKPKIPSENRFLRGKKRLNNHLAIFAGFWESFGSSEDDSFGSQFFDFCVLKSSPRERGVVPSENRQIFLEERDLRDAPNQGRGSSSCVPQRGLSVPRTGHELGVASSFSAASGLGPQ